MVALLLIACFLLSALLVVIIAVSYQAFRLYRDLTEDFYNFTHSPGKDKDGQDMPSEMAITVDLMAAQFAARIGQTLHAAFNGQASGMARGLKAVEAEISQAAVAQSGNPLSMIAASLFQKQIKKNPMLGMALSQFNFGGGGGVATTPSNGHSQSKLGF